MTTGARAAPRDAQSAIINPFAGRDVNWLLDLRADKTPDRPFLVWEPFEGPPHAHPAAY